MFLLRSGQRGFPWMLSRFSRGTEPIVCVRVHVCACLGLRAAVGMSETHTPTPYLKEVARGIRGRNSPSWGLGLCSRGRQLAAGA